MKIKKKVLFLKEREPISLKDIGSEKNLFFGKPFFFPKNEPLSETPSESISASFKQARLMANKKGNIPELTVSEAASLLDVSTRTIINYIKDKEIEATKVGKSWFIKAPSFDSFCQRYKFKRPEQSRDNQDQVLKRTPSSSEAPTTSNTRQKKKDIYSITQLRLFEISCQVLKKFNPQDLNLSNHKTLDRIENLKQDAIELLGAGCYSFRKEDKQRLYQNSREKIGSIVSLY